MRSRGSFTVGGLSAGTKYPHSNSFLLRLSATAEFLQIKGAICERERARNSIFLRRFSRLELKSVFSTKFAHAAFTGAIAVL